MITWLAKRFIKDNQNVSSPKVRQAYGMLCGAVGIFLNVILFGLKLFAGAISGSIAITADAFNNLSDAGSSIITLVGFKMAGQKPDPDHPFGHGRIEYIAGLIVSFVIILMGVELGKSSIEKILHPEAVAFSGISIAILIISIATKLYMTLFNRGIGKKLDSATMRATAMDSLSDSIATSVVLIAMLISKFAGINIDGYCGVLVALFILYAGFRAAKETIDPLLGQPPEETFVKQIQDIVLAHKEVVGIHDLVVHNYGPGRVMISLHAEVPATGDILVMHDAIDNIEHQLRDEMGCEAVIHMDPIATQDAPTVELREKVAELVKELDVRITIHDFRIVPGPTHTNVIFDAVVPFDCQWSDAQVKDAIAKMVAGLEGNYFAVVQIDKAYVK